MPILEEDMELLAKYKRNKHNVVALRIPQGAFLKETFTMQELMRLSKLIENDKL